MTESNDHARQQFLADIISELTRQQEEDSDAFNGIQKTTNEQLFRKLCFDFPIINETEWNQISCGIDNLLRISCITSSFYDEFYLNDKFIENALSKCEIGTETENIKQNTKIATTLFFLLPTCLLQSKTSRLMKLLKSKNNTGNTLTWRAVIQYFHDFVKQITISTICNNISKDHSLKDNATTSTTTLVLLQEKDYIEVLCQTISALAQWIVETEQTLEDSNAATSSSIVTEKEKEEEGAGGMQTEEECLIDELGTLQQHTDTGISSTMLDMLNNLIKQSSRNAKDMKVLQSVYSILKPTWLHLALFMRDLFIHYPSLLPTKLNSFLTALQRSDSNNINSNSNNLINVFHTMNIKSKQCNFPSTKECIYVVILASLCAHYSNFTTTTMNIAYIVSILHAKKTLCGYLNQNLVCFIDICTRMHINTTSNANKSDTKQEKIDLEVTGFLIDIAMIYSNDPNRTVSALSNTTARQQQKQGASPGNTVPSLVASRLLPLLLSTLCNILQQQQQEHEKGLDQTVSDSVEQEGSTSGTPPATTVSVLSTPAFNLISERLIRCIGLLIVPSAGNGPAVLRYILDYPGLCGHLARLPSKWSMPNVHSSDTPTLVVCDIFSIVSSLLLASLHTLVTPISTSMVVSLSTEVQEALLTVLSSASTVVKSKLKACLATYTTVLLSSTKDCSKPTEKGSEENVIQPILSEEHSTDETTEPSIEHSTMSNPDTSEKKAKKLQKQEQASHLHFLRSLEYALNILVGEGGYAMTFRAVCSTVITMQHQQQQQQNGSSKSSNIMGSVYTVCIIVQAMFLQFADDSLAIINEVLIILTRTEEVEDNNNSSGSSNTCTVLRPQIEVIKKKLKTLQGLLREGSTSKSD